MDCPEDEDITFFLGFVDVLYDVFHRNCKDLNEMRHLVAMIFPKYIQPVLENQAQRTETTKLFRLVQPFLTAAADKLYLREISSAEWERKSAENELDISELTSKNLGDCELPYFSRFLLIASYLASYNPPRLDQRFFTRGSEANGKKRGRKQGADKTGKKTRQQLVGPKAFPVERMLAIFFSILERPLDSTVDIHSQIASLITLRLLIRTTSMDALDNMKCKTNVSYEYVKKVSRTVRFEIEKYLFDFL
ncbi:hypothetical protein K7432_005333 [Basidiobolus ranarum]|uniref:Origin recognition complex subunit 5 n=1 Tax=Basidiobolus ranarum TaxID=34480 RepID=A0ABR2W3S6_9FUNG